eukprot:CAMPEP_0184865294 /NCGR_PEP_ID=MMETSP0580-20130426/17584_1 /TAXON_ID=1118495 /ORGANISM="Dactyliosolen fragilissimus" /LENGTH=208 /DNA_ID=CAMNT_0027364429 /DNA_START=230 /DNA_END=856 /DNA_ORIENTATION=+
MARGYLKLYVSFLSLVFVFVIATTSIGHGVYVVAQEENQITSNPVSSTVDTSEEVELVESAEVEEIKMDDTLQETSQEAEEEEEEEEKEEIIESELNEVEVESSEEEQEEEENSSVSEAEIEEEPENVTETQSEDEDFDFPAVDESNMSDTQLSQDDETHGIPSTFKKAISSKQNIKKIAAAGLGIWGCATGVGWAMQNFGASDKETS